MTEDSGKRVGVGDGRPALKPVQPGEWNGGRQPVKVVPPPPPPPKKG